MSSFTILNYSIEGISKTILRGLIISSLVIACSTPASPQIKEINNQELTELIKNGDIQLVDVRTAEEVADGFIDGALNIDFRSADFESKIGELDKNKPIVVYCGAGSRSGTASDLLLELGYKEIYDLSGGFNHWKQENQPIKTPQ